jgi:hypothetical protein
MVEQLVYIQQAKVRFFHCPLKKIDIGSNGASLEAIVTNLAENVDAPRLDTA